MKFIYAMLILMTGFVQNGISQEVFCRYKYQKKIYYGKVENDQVRALDKAPWWDGQVVGEPVKLEDVKLLNPAQPKTIIGIGKPVASDWKENGWYKAPRWFIKPPTSAGSPGDHVVLPDALDKVKVEVELVIVIGKKIKNADEAEAEDAIFGYTIGNDIAGDKNSYHKLQGEPLDLAENILGPGLKAGDKFAPFGPFIYTGIDWKDRLKTLRITDKLGEEKLNYSMNTSELLYTPAQIVSAMSNVLTLSPGDVIFSGAAKAFPAENGDVVELSIEGLGKMHNKIVKR